MYNNEYHDYDELEEYTFAEYLADIGVIESALDVDYFTLEFLWDMIYSEDYIEYCKQNKLMYERVK